DLETVLAPCNRESVRYCSRRRSKLPVYRSTRSANNHSFRIRVDADQRKARIGIGSRPLDADLRVFDWLLRKADAADEVVAEPHLIDYLRGEAVYGLQGEDAIVVLLLGAETGNIGAVSAFVQRQGLRSIREKELRCEPVALADHIIKVRVELIFAVTR